jgi:hypothetical protein
MLTKNGPEGYMLWTAMSANIVAAYLVGIVGVTVLNLSGGDAAAGGIAASVIVVAVLLGLVVASVRAVQCVRPGRVHRATRSNLGP